MLRLSAPILLASVLVLTGDAPARSLRHTQGPIVRPTTSPATVVAGEMQVTAEWFDLLFGLAPKRFESRPQRRPPRQDERSSKVSGGTYRTLCVRLCDGFYFPISYSTVRTHFKGDATQCEQRCPGVSRLYVHRNPGEGIENMLDLNGRAYVSLPNALMYRTQYVADCTCRGNPWDEASLARHRGYSEGGGGH